MTVHKVFVENLEENFSLAVFRGASAARRPNDGLGLAIPLEENCQYPKVSSREMFYMWCLDGFNDVMRRMLPC